VTGAAAVEPCGEYVEAEPGECWDLDCGGCSCFASAPCTHCLEHTSCVLPTGHDGDCDPDPDHDGQPEVTP
jgi:hypothetical protein